MDTFEVKGTDTTPTIKFDFTQGRLEIKGVSISENTLEFFKPLLENIDKYAANPKSVTDVDIQLDYFNTTSSKCILDVFIRFANIHRKGGQVNINWYFEKEDEDMREAGKDYQAIVNMEFNMIETETE